MIKNIKFYIRLKICSIFFENEHILRLFFTITASVSCYNKSTKILTLQNNEEIYKTIETLRPGDMIKIYPNDYKPIKYIGYKKLINNPTDNNTMYIMKKTETNNLVDDLIVTGWHFIEDPNNNSNCMLFIHDKILKPVNTSHLFTKINDNQEYTYYHLVLDTEQDKHCGIWANGLISESTTISYFMYSKFNAIEKLNF